MRDIPAPPASGGDAAQAAPFRPAVALARRWYLVVGTAIATVVLAMLVLAVLPPSYTAHAVLIPSVYDRPSGGAAGGAIPGAFAGLMGAGVNPQQQMLATVLKSRTLRERVVAAESARSAPAEVNRLMKGLQLERRADNGSIDVGISSRDPEQAARIVNLFPAAINEVMGGVANEAARRKQLFLEAQVRDAREELSRSEERMLVFQQTRNVPEPEGQASRTLEAAAALQSTISAKELEVAQLRRTSTPDNPRLRAALADLSGLRGQLSQLTSSSSSSEIFVPLRRGPELRVASARLLREFKEDEQVYATLTGALAQARLDANNNLPVVSVLDPATVPVVPTSSTRLVLMVSTVMGLLGGAAVVLALEYLRSRRTAL
ncbi:MAG TPA: Wzz/FepE/Etk N-terminal domain-containing protein [Longimicrobium sp.]|nr:Wzz/FepE/Etk N-terminal domain-containing protein [Longimicrobium sp.]